MLGALTKTPLFHSSPTSKTLACVPQVTHQKKKHWVIAIMRGKGSTADTSNCHANQHVKILMMPDTLSFWFS
jgi:hypothetical protein